MNPKIKVSRHTHTKKVGEERRGNIVRISFFSSTILFVHWITMQTSSDDVAEVKNVRKKRANNCNEKLYVHIYFNTWILDYYCCWKQQKEWNNIMEKSCTFFLVLTSSMILTRQNNDFIRWLLSRMPCELLIMCKFLQKRENKNRNI